MFDRPQSITFFTTPSRQLMSRLPITERLAQEQPNTLITDVHCLVIYNKTHDDLWIYPCESHVLRDNSIEERERMFAKAFMDFLLNRK